jgi:hypothetical protein
VPHPSETHESRDHATTHSGTVKGLGPLHASAPEPREPARDYNYVTTNSAAPPTALLGVAARPGPAAGCAPPAAATT